MIRLQSGEAGSSSRRIDDPLDNYLQIDLARLLYWLQRKKLWIGAAAVGGALLGAAFVIATPAQYTATSDIMIDPSGVQVVNDDIFGRSEQRDAQVLNADTKLQTLLSRNVLLRVIERLDLARDAEFVPPPSTFSLGGGSQRGDPAIIALENLKKRVIARRDERSFILSLSVRSLSGEKSVRIAEAIISEFRAELIAADAESASRTATTLTARLDELKDSVNRADDAVETFRRENGLRVSNGELVSSRSMSQVDSQLREARERLIAAESRNGSLNAGDIDSMAMQSATLSALRTQYAALKQRVDSQLASLGPRHPRRQAAELELQSLRSEIGAESARLSRAAQNEVAQARSVVEALERESETLSGDVFLDNAAEVTLRELTREAAARTSIYESFLARSGVAAERQQLDSTNIRVVSPPVLPPRRSWPPSLSQAVTFGGAAGLALGSLGVVAFGIAADIRGAQKPLPRQPTQPRPIQPVTNRAPAPRQPRNSSPGSLLNVPIPASGPYHQGRRRRAD